MPQQRQPAAADDVEDLINPSDFESIRFEIKISNTTTKTKTEKDAEIRIIEFGDRALVLELPPKTCAQGHHLLLEVVALGIKGRKKLPFTATCKVDEAEDLGDGSDRITVTLVQFDERQWEELQSSFSSRQEEIEAFLRSAKGL